VVQVITIDDARIQRTTRLTETDLHARNSRLG
jgi:hypothetical protein